jgi:hypothetical protein
MTLSITPIVSVMPDAGRLGYSFIHYLVEFEHVLSKVTSNQIQYDPGSMLVFTGACVKYWYQVAGLKRRWVRQLDSQGVYALGVDAFETEVD